MCMGRAIVLNKLYEIKRVHDQRVKLFAIKLETKQLDSLSNIYLGRDAVKRISLNDAYKNFYLPNYSALYKNISLIVFLKTCSAMH